MTRTFVMTPEFDKCWKELGLNDDNLKDLQERILINPLIGPVITGTGGLRKVRYSIKEKGKSGGVRVLYVDLLTMEKVFLITAYSKSVKDNISDEEKKILRSLVKQLKDSTS